MAIGQTQTEISEVFVDEGTENSTAYTVPSTNYLMNVNLEEHNEGLKTSAGNAIKRLLGCDDDLVKFDGLLFTLKIAKRAGNHIHMPDSISEYNKLVRKMKTKVKLVQSDRAAKLTELEHKQFQQNGKLPAKTPGSHYYKVLKERNLATNILRVL